MCIMIFTRWSVEELRNNEEIIENDYIEKREKERKPRWCINEDGDGEGDRTLKML